MRHVFITLLALTYIAASCPFPAWANSENSSKSSVWKENRRAYLDKREAYFQKKIDFYDRYKKRTYNSLYRQKAQEFYGRQPGIYDNDDSNREQNRYIIE